MAKLSCSWGCLSLALTVAAKTDAFSGYGLSMRKVLVPCETAVSPQTRMGTGHGDQTKNQMRPECCAGDYQCTSIVWDCRIDWRCDKSSRRRSHGGLWILAGLRRRPCPCRPIAVPLLSAEDLLWHSVAPLLLQAPVAPCVRQNPCNPLRTPRSAELSKWSIQIVHTFFSWIPVKRTMAGETHISR